MKYLFPFIIIAILLSSCEGNGSEKKEKKRKLVIAAAANVQFAMKELEQAFESERDIDLEVIISSSGKLTAQIQQGAPYDMFLSADMKFPESLYRNGFSIASPEVYAYGALVLWTTKELDLVKEGIAILRKAEIKKIAVANPRNAPYGEQAIRVLKYYGLYKQVAGKLVYGESIAQTNQYILSKACDLGLTAKSVVLAPKVSGTGRWIEMPAAAYAPIQQGVVITRYGWEKHPEASRIFYEFLFSEPARNVFEQYGYNVPGGK